MAKRNAENEMNRDNYEMEVEATESPGTFKKASAADIQKRVIKMPKSKIAGSTAFGDLKSNMFSSAAPGGSGASNDTKSLFSFGSVTASQPISSPKSSSTVSANPFQALSSSSNSPFQFSAADAEKSKQTPFEQPNSPTKQSIASVTFSGKKTGLSNSNQAQAFTGPNVIGGQGIQTLDTTAASKLAAKLRGLNHSLLTSIKKEYEQSFYFDASDLLNQYQKHRKSIIDVNKDIYEALLQASKAQNASVKIIETGNEIASFGEIFSPDKPDLSGPTPAPTPAVSEFGLSAASTTFKFPSADTTPVKPVSFAPSSSFSSSQQEASPSTLESKSGSFSFGSSSTAAASLSTNGSEPNKFGSSSVSFGSSSVAASPAPLSANPFGSTQTQVNFASPFGNPSPVKTAHTLGSPTAFKSGTSSGILVDTINSAQNQNDSGKSIQKEENKPVFTFSTPFKSSFAEKDAGNTSIFSFNTPAKSDDTSKQIASPEKKQPMNVSSAESLQTSSSFPTTATVQNGFETAGFKASAFSFTATEQQKEQPKPAPSLFSFGDSPVSFGGSQSIKPTLTFNPPQQSVFSKSENSVEKQDSENEDEDEESAQQSSEPSQLVVGDEETQDETLYEVRSKLMKTVKTDQGAVKWTSIGLGALKLNLHKESGRKRLLMRADGTGRLVLNSTLFGGMKVGIQASQPKYVSFTVFLEGKLAKIYAQVKTAEAAQELKDAILKHLN